MGRSTAPDLSVGALGFGPADERDGGVHPGAAGAARAPAAHHAPRAAGRLVCFTAGEEKRRLYPPPPAWDAVSDAELEALCARAQAGVPPAAE